MIFFILLSLYVNLVEHEAFELELTEHRDYGEAQKVERVVQSAEITQEVQSSICLSLHGMSVKVVVDLKARDLVLAGVMDP